MSDKPLGQLTKRKIRSKSIKPKIKREVAAGPDEVHSLGKLRFSKTRKSIGNE